MLHYQLKTNFTEISLDKWNNLLKDTATSTVFQTPEYCQAWWNVFVHSDTELCLIVVYDEKEIVGVAPVRKQQDKITFLGTDRVGSGGDLVTDFGDIVAKKGLEKEVWAEVLKACRQTEGFWTSQNDGKTLNIELDYVRESSPSFNVLKNEGHQISEMIDNAQPDVAPYLDLPNSWEEYLTQLDRKERHELRRKLRRLEEHGYTMEKVELVAQVGQVGKEEAIKEFIRLHKTSTVEKDRFMTSQMAEFFTKVANNLSSKNLVDLTFMRFGQENVAATFSFVWKNEYWLYNSGFNRVYDNLAVGFLLKSLTIKMAIEKGYKRYSFLRGNERYKYDLGAKDEKLYKIIINLK